MLRDIGVIMLCVGVVLLAISLILIFVLKIPDLLDELSGRKAKRQIERLKKLNVGTGSLEGMDTDDVYLALSSGSLVSEDIEVQTKISSRDLDEETNTGDIQVDSSGNRDGSSGSLLSSNEEENTPVSREIKIEEVSKESNISEEDPTGFMDVDETDTEDAATSYVGEGEVTGMLNEIQEYENNKKVIEIIEEQTSLK